MRIKNRDDRLRSLRRPRTFRFDEGVEIRNLHRHYHPHRSSLKKIVRLAARSERYDCFSVVFVFVSDRRIRELNKKFKSRDSATDVLAFGFDTSVSRGELCGDVIVSVDTARRQSRVLGVDFNEEILRYCIHGILHLCGYNDLKDRDKKRMWKKQEDLLKKARNVR